MSCWTTSRPTRPRRSNAGSSATPGSTCTSPRPTARGSTWVERWFAELTNKWLRRGTHRSVRHLTASIEPGSPTGTTTPNPSCGTNRRRDPRRPRHLLPTDLRLTPLGVERCPGGAGGGARSTPGRAGRPPDGGAAGQQHSATPAWRCRKGFQRAPLGQLRRAVRGREGPQRCLSAPGQIHRHSVSLRFRFRFHFLCRCPGHRRCFARCCRLRLRPALRPRLSRVRLWRAAARAARSASV
jgi:hypothetical protein